MTRPDRPSPVERAQLLADELVRPQAEQVDRTVVPRTTLNAWAAAGLLGLAGPRSAGGGGASARVEREVQEVLAGACGATWFVATQHATPLATLAASGNSGLRERLLAPMCSGQVLAGVAFTHLRRPGPPRVTAVRRPGGWRFDGEVDWLTGWGLCDVVLLAGESPDGEAVFVLVPARDAAGLTASPPLALAAMQATRTVGVRLEGLVVPDADVVRVVDLATWREDDAVRAADARPHVFGLQRECVRRLRETAAARGDGAAAALAQQLSAEGERVRRVAYALADELPRGEALEDRMAVRAASLELAVRSATALVAASGGSAMLLDAAPQRLAREAVFYLVQAQTPAVREATLQLLRDSGA